MNVDNSKEPTKPCISCKTFFGKESSEWLCSVCYKNKSGGVVAKNSKKEEEPAVQVSIPQPEVPAVEVKQVDKSRCSTCNKKVGLLGIECKCQLVFCNMHRMPEDHQCTINYRQIGQKHIEKNNQKVVARKISQI